MKRLMTVLFFAALSVSTAFAEDYTYNHVGDEIYVVEYKNVDEITCFESVFNPHVEKIEGGAILVVTGCNFWNKNDKICAEEYFDPRDVILHKTGVVYDGK